MFGDIPETLSATEWQSLVLQLSTSWLVCVHVYMYVCLHVYVYVCMFACIYMYVCMFIYVCMFACICVCMCVCGCMYIYSLCIYVCMYICVRVCARVMACMWRSDGNLGSLFFPVTIQVLGIKLILPGLVASALTGWGRWPDPNSWF